MAKAMKRKAVAAKATKKKATTAKTMKKTTESVIQHHVQALMSRDLDEILKDYCEESVLCTPMGTAKGLKGIRESFIAALGMLTPEAMGNMKAIKQDIQGEYAYALWSALPAVKLGSDTFHVHNGIIIMQSFVGQM